MEKIRISLEAARVNAKMTQHEAAQRMNISVKTLQNHEAGRTVPTWPMAERYSALYKMPLDHIFFGSNSA